MGAVESYRACGIYGNHSIACGAVVVEVVMLWDQSTFEL